MRAATERASAAVGEADYREADLADGDSLGGRMAVGVDGFAPAG